MNKQKQLTKTVVAQTVVALIILAVVAGIYFVTDSMESDAQAKQTAADTAYNSANSEVNNLKSQLEKSGEAEKGFALMQTVRINPDFTADSEGLRDVLRADKAQYRFSNNFKLTVSPEKPADKASQITQNYNVTVRPYMRMDFEAISDTHVYSFMEEFLRQAPGLIRYESLSLKRKSDMDAASLAEMQRGGAPDLVEATIEFSWIGVAPMAAKPGDKPAAGAGH